MLRKSAAATVALLLLGFPLEAASAADDEAPLTTYVKDSVGQYGYSDVPVETYPGSGTQVRVPREDSAENRRFSGGWVATIANLNFGKPADAADFDARYSAVLDDFESWNMNAVIFQVRPLLDAYYPSDLNPWSEFITGTQGLDPGYDPLARAVEATHARGMEFHAWLNPYRVTNEKMTSTAILDALGMDAEQVTALSTPEYIAALHSAGILADGNYAVEHPEQVLSFDGKLFLNPGYPAVQGYVAASVSEIVENYDVDAIHFDDYFYPYRIAIDGQNVYFGDEGEDRATFEEFGLPAGYADSADGVEQWRRDNITALITEVGEAISAHNDNAGTAVQFGVSPFGIWEHKANDPAGSNTPAASSQSYSGAIFADTRGWVQNELVDYLSPQIYWSFDQAAAPYGELAQWWSDTATNSRTQIYIGHALYKHVNNGGWEQAWMNPEEIPNQMRFNQKLDGVEGSILFSYNDMKTSDVTTLPDDDRPKHEAKNKAIELLKSGAFGRPTLVPAMPWLSDGNVASPVDVRVVKDALEWSSAADATNARQYAIYHGIGTPEEIVDAEGTLIDTVWAGGGTKFAMDLPVTRAAGEGTWVVTALDAAAVESPPVAAEVSTSPADPTDPTEPTDPTDPTGSGDDSSAEGDLAATGASPLPMIGAGIVLLAIGATVIRISRRTP